MDWAGKMISWPHNGLEGWSRSPSPQRVSTDTCQGVNGKSQRDTLHSATRVDGESWPPREHSPILMWASVFQGQSGRGDKVDAASCSSTSTRRVISCFLHSIDLILGLVFISGWALVARVARFISLLLLRGSLLRCIIIDLFLSPGWFWFSSQSSLHSHAKHQEIVHHPRREVRPINRGHWPIVKMPSLSISELNVVLSVLGTPSS